MKSFKILAFLIAVFVSMANLNSAWWSNWPPPPPPTLSTTSESNDLDYLIVDGASNMLQAYSSFIQFINESELSCKSPFNFSKAGELLDNAIKTLYTAKDNYTKALGNIRLLELPVDQIERFKSFDYNAFADTRKLNPRIMERVKSYLEKGDIVYYFDRIIRDLDDMIAALKAINSRLKVESQPDMEDLRTAYEKFSDYMLSGYYSSLVFDKIR